jgi:hypothetical protein
MTSIYVIILTIGHMEVGHITGKTSAVCNQMPAMVETLEALWGQPVDAFCRDTRIPFLRPVARP